VTGKEALGGAQGEAVAWQGTEGRVRVKGEIWRARSIAELAPGIRVRVVGHDGLVLIVEPA
jgi:membrane-bound serine protease (ClpP class)